MKRILFVALLIAALAAWWVGDHVITPWLERVTGYDRIQNRHLSVLLGHWVFGQLPRVLLCVAVWLVGTRQGLMPPLRQAFGSGGALRRVVVTGLFAAVILLVVTIAIGAAADGTFGFHPYVPKMAGDLVSNMYEELVYRGLLFSTFYGVATAARFPLTGPLSRVGLVVGTIGSCAVFGIGHEQYEPALRVVVGVVAVVFVYPWVAARSLWAPWIAHMLGDIVGDTILTL